MNRRDAVLALLALGAAADPRVATSQTSPRMPTIGFLALGAAPASGAEDRTPIAAGLKALGWVEGQNIRIERAYADNKYERLALLAAELVRKKVDLIYAQGPDPAHAAAQATKTIPIVFFGPTFPVEQGLVDSYARPGRNATGVAWSAGNEVYVKLLAFVKELVPDATRVAYLRPLSPVPGRQRELQLEYVPKQVSAAKEMGFELRPFNVSGPEDFDPAFKAIQAWRPQALYSHGTPITFPQLKRIADFANANRLPSFFDSRFFAEQGGFFSYGPEISQLFVQSAAQVDRILRGANPATVPVEMPTRYELFVNRKTTNHLGIKMPQSILLSADKVIE
jgi:putative ABC transport system substrate-binding protein